MLRAQHNSQPDSQPAKLSDADTADMTRALLTRQSVLLRVDTTAIGNKLESLKIDFKAIAIAMQTLVNCFDSGAMVRNEAYTHCITSLPARTRTPYRSESSRDFDLSKCLAISSWALTIVGFFPVADALTPHKVT